MPDTAPHQDQQFIVIADCYGRLANRLTVLANVLAYAIENHAVVVDVAMRQALAGDILEHQHEVAGSLVFNGNRKCRSWLCRFSIRTMARYRKEVERVSFAKPQSWVARLCILRGDGETRVDLIALASTHAKERCIALTGIFLESTQPTDSTVTEIRRLLRPHAKHVEFSAEVLKQFDPDVKVIGVHVRHGDYRTWKDGRFFHPFEEYVQAMEKMQQSLRIRAVFLIVSDEEQDMTLCRESLDTHRIEGNEMQDLVLLSQCDYLIATHSSFANWASFYGQVPILTMRDALGPSLVDPCKLKPVEFPRLQGDYVI